MAAAYLIILIFKLSLLFKVKKIENTANHGNIASPRRHLHVNLQRKELIMIYLPQILIGASSSRKTGCSMKISRVILHNREISFSLILTLRPPELIIWLMMASTSSLFCIFDCFYCVLVSLWVNLFHWTIRINKL